jgi:hypothetical protein
MNTLLKKIKAMRMGKNTLWFMAMLVVGIAMFYLLAFVLTPFAPMSRFPAAILLMYIGILCLMYMDKIHHGDINTRLAIEKNNIAYALIMLSYAVIIAAVLVSV